MTHGKKVTKSLPMGASRVTPPHREARLPGRSAGAGYLGRGGGGEPPQRRGPSPQPGPPPPTDERRQRFRHGQESSAPPAGARASPGPGGDGAARTSSTPPWPERPKPAPAPLACPLLPPPGPSRDAGPAVGRLAARSGVRAEGSARAAAHSPLLAPRRPPGPPDFTLPSGALPVPAPRHVTSGRGPHVTPPFLSSLPPQRRPPPRLSPAPLACPAQRGEAVWRRAPCSTLRRRGGLTAVS